MKKDIGKPKTIADYKEAYHQTKKANWHLCKVRDQALLRNARLQKTLDVLRSELMKEKESR